MPIAQTRMIALVRAALDYQQGLETILKLIEEQSHLLREGKSTPEQFLNILIPSAKLQFLLTNPVGSAVIVITEEKHFRANARRNANKARKLKENREADRAGHARPKRATTAPPRIDRARGVPQNLIQETGVVSQDDFGPELELGQSEGQEVRLPPGYVPGEISEKQKAEIAEFAEQQKAGEKFQPLPGFAVPQSVCVHTFAEPGDTCQDCGKQLPGE